jgi:hypothetical protein
MALTINQFCAAVASDKRKPPKLCGHKGCTKPLGPRFGEHNRPPRSTRLAISRAGPTEPECWAEQFFRIRAFRGPPRGRARPYSCFVLERRNSAIMLPKLYIVPLDELLGIFHRGLIVGAHKSNCSADKTVFVHDVSSI